MGTMNRPNLFFAAEEFPDRSRMLRRLLELFDVAAHQQADRGVRQAAPTDSVEPSPYSPTVIYVRKKADCDELARALEARGVRAAAFHSSLDQEAKQSVQQAFHVNELQVVVATVAFGMGIDKPDVRRVFHFGMPSGLEAYAQESGRAGRDGRPARCVVLFTAADRTQRERAVLGNTTIQYELI